MMTTITASDVVTVHNRYLYTARQQESNNEGERFLIKGIAFPDAPLPQAVVGAKDDDDDDDPKLSYNATGWIAVLQQLRHYMPASALNTVRVYRMDPLTIDYSEFFHAAAQLGFYVIVPLTSNRGSAVLDRSVAPPHCYPPALYQHGRKLLLKYLQYPNVLAGVIGNEVMNSMESWQAAPCVKAYARDLKLYMEHLNSELNFNAHLERLLQPRVYQGALRPLPLTYACQHSGIGAALNSVDTVRLSLDYLTCSQSPKQPPKAKRHDNNKGVSTKYDNDNDDSDNDDNDDDDLLASIDLLGVNIESWCASSNTFQYNNVEGTVGTYYQLWQGLHANVPIPLFFSEMGCSHYEFNRDSPEVHTHEGTRDWKQVPVVLHNMKDTWSGFSAYAYDGNPLFDMMQNGPWNGQDVLQPSQDFFHFQQELILATNGSTTSTDSSNTSSLDDNIQQHKVVQLHPLPLQNGGIMEDYYKHMDERDSSSKSSSSPVPCSEVENVLLRATDLELYDFSRMPSYFDAQHDDSDILAEMTTKRHPQSHDNIATDSIAPSAVAATAAGAPAPHGELKLRPRYHRFLWNIIAPLLIVVTGTKFIVFRRWTRRASYHTVD